MSPQSREALDHHIGKWQRREPEMELAEVFCPAARRAHFRAWGALLFELREAVFELSDARVTAVKTAWWAETLHALGQGQARHPLTEAFHAAAPAADWSALAAALLATAQYEGRPSSPAEALASVQPLADAVARTEAALFGAQLQTEAVRATAVHWLLQRLPQGLGGEDGARIPLNLLARHGLTGEQLAAGQGEPLLRDWAATLAGELPPRLPGACLYRRLRHGFDAARLQRLAAGRGFAPPPALATVWRGWRVARSG